MAESDSHAVVLGAGMAGLLAARVLSEFYRSVTVVERDALPDRVEQRTGVPQGRHLHNFLGRGTQVLGELFPGLLDELAAAGAVVDDGDDLSRVYVRLAGYELNPVGRLSDPGPLAAYQASRPLLEFQVRRRVALLANVDILDNYDAEPMVADDSVTGARIIHRDSGIASDLDAGLVVDATGRAARTARLLETHDFGLVPEDQIPSTGGYSSQLLHIPPGHIKERLAFVTEGAGASGALLVAYEHDTWMLAAARPTEYGSPPTNFTEMLTAAEQMLPTTIMAGLREAVPVGDVSISRTTAAAWRRYDRMTDLPIGLVVLGDALCNLNPLHGQGMTLAVLQALALRDCLRAGHVDLPRRFYRAATKLIGPVWAMNKANDRVPSAAERRSVWGRLRNWMQHAALRAAATDITVHEQILRVRNLIDPPTSLQERSLFVRILRANLRYRRYRRIDIHRAERQPCSKPHTATPANG